MRVRDVRRPVADGLTRRILERASAGGDRDDLRAEQLHAKDVELLALDVECAHEDVALHAEERGDRRRSDTVLAGARLSDDALLAHALREQGLAERIVDLVGTRVQEVFALEEDLCAAVVLRELVGIVEVRRAARVLAQVSLELILEVRVVLVLCIGGLELVERRHDDFRHILSTKFSKSALRVHLCSSFLACLTLSCTACMGIRPYLPFLRRRLPSGASARRHSQRGRGPRRRGCRRSPHRAGALHPPP